MVLVSGIFTAEPPQIFADAGLVITAIGLIVTVTVWGVPGHPPVVEVGVTVYVTV